MSVERNGHHRLDAILKLLSQKRCSHILVTDSVDCEYVTGFHASNIFLLIGRLETLLFSDFRYKEAAYAFCRKHPPWRFIETKEAGYSILSSHCPKGSIIGFQSNCMSIDRFDSLEKRLKNVRFVKLRDAISELCIPKTPLETASMKKAAKIGDAALARALPHLEIGITEKKFAQLLENECRLLGSEKPSFETIVLFGVRSALPHGRPTDACLKKGDLILMDFGCSVDGFVSDMTRTVVACPASDRQKAIYAVVAKAQRKAREAVCESVTAAAIDKIARSIISEAGYGKYFGHATGHGVGRAVHEKPKIAKTNKALLAKGSVITIEPGIYIPDFGGIRIEDMVVVGKNGCETITSSTHRFTEIIL